MIIFSLSLALIQIANQTDESKGGDFCVSSQKVDPSNAIDIFGDAECAGDAAQQTFFVDADGCVEDIQTSKTTQKEVTAAGSYTTDKDAGVCVRYCYSTEGYDYVSSYIDIALDLGTGSAAAFVAEPARQWPNQHTPQQNPAPRRMPGQGLPGKPLPAPGSPAPGSPAPGSPARTPFLPSLPILPITPGNSNPGNQQNPGTPSDPKLFCVVTKEQRDAVKRNCQATADARLSNIRAMTPLWSDTCENYALIAKNEADAACAQFQRCQSLLPANERSSHPVCNSQGIFDEFKAQCESHKQAENQRGLDGCMDRAREQSLQSAMLCSPAHYQNYEETLAACTSCFESVFRESCNQSVIRCVDQFIPPGTPFNERPIVNNSICRVDPNEVNAHCALP